MMKGIEHIRQRLSPLWKKYFSHGSFLRNTFWMTVGLGLRTGSQVIYFILLARTLKAEAYGIFAGMQALVNLFSAFSSWGSGSILVKNVSRRPEAFPIQWGSALTITILCSSVLGLIVYFVSGMIYSFETAVQVALPMAVGDLLGLSMVNISAHAFQAFQKLSRSSLIWVLLTTSRLVMVLLLFLLPVPKTSQIWALFYGVSGLLAGTIALMWVRRELGWGPLNLQGMHSQWREGLFFSVSVSAQGAYNDIDKTLLSRISGGAIAGTYSAAYRFLDAVFIPVQALLYASYPRFFKEGGKSLKDARHFAARLIPWAVGWAAFAWLILALGSPILTLLLGQEYAQVPQIVVWLGPILIFRAVHYLLANTLTGSGFQGIRSAAQVGVAFFNFGLNLWLIPRFGWMGAVISSLVSDSGLALILWLLLSRLKNIQADQSEQLET